MPLEPGIKKPANDSRRSDSSCTGLTAVPSPSTTTTTLRPQLHLHSWPSSVSICTADKSHPKVIKLIEDLKNIFTFREWKEGPSLEYCGATLEATDGGWKLHHKEYLKKVKPITVGEDRQPHQQVTDKERNLLRSLLGALQWPAVQSSPHVQIHTSMFSGEITTATIETIHNTNKALRYAKSNDDVGLTYRPIAPIADCCLVAWSDAASTYQYAISHANTPPRRHSG